VSESKRGRCPFRDDEPTTYRLPELYITGFEIGKIRNSLRRGGKEFDVTLRVENPTPNTIPLASVDARITFGVWLSNAYRINRDVETGDIDGYQKVDLTLKGIPAFSVQKIFMIEGKGFETASNFTNLAHTRVRNGEYGRDYPCCTFKGRLIKPLLRPWRLG